MSNLFYVNQMPFAYADLSRGANQVSERTVEVALGNFFRKLLPPEDVLEVGNVLYQYASDEDQRDWHTVVDLKEQFPHVTNADIRDWRGGKSFKIIVCISTLEHVGEDANDKLMALNVMKAHLAFGGLLFVTMPVGWKPDTNTVIADAYNNFDSNWFVVRDGDAWKEVHVFGVSRMTPEKLSRLPQYNEHYKRANALYLGVYRK